MSQALFDPAECEAERTVIIAEREGGENDPFWLLNEEVQATAFHAHPYRHPVIGWKNDLHQIQPPDLVAALSHLLHAQQRHRRGHG